MTETTPSTPTTSNTPSKENGETNSSLGPWHVVGLGIIMIAMVVVIWRVIGRWSDAKDAAAVLAVVIPVFATIGAAIFGIQVAYSTGKSSGTAEGKAEGTKEGRKAVAQGLNQLLGDPAQTGGVVAAGATPDDTTAAAQAYILGILDE